MLLNFSVEGNSQSKSFAQVVRICEQLQNNLPDFCFHSVMFTPKEWKEKYHSGEKDEGVSIHNNLGEDFSLEKFLSWLRNSYGAVIESFFISDNNLNHIVSENECAKQLLVPKEENCVFEEKVELGDANPFPLTATVLLGESSQNEQTEREPTKDFSQQTKFLETDLKNIPETIERLDYLKTQEKQFRATLLEQEKVKCKEIKEKEDLHSSEEAEAENSEEDDESEEEEN
eukprot:GCRY01000875.1.p1 GENE.GCRY01000875.1~~GCRY01000875.1.p1  ORF type:complete len:230 (-),score=44.07 GCRY01000875.1:233-922(-)